MNSWGTSREVEKVKPFADRAEKCCAELADYHVALAKIVGYDRGIVHALATAEGLLTEAIRRGVKGKD